MENFQDRGVLIRIRFVLRGWIRIRSISDRIRNPVYECAEYSLILMAISYFLPVARSSLWFYKTWNDGARTMGHHMHHGAISLKFLVPESYDIRFLCI